MNRIITFDIISLDGRLIRPYKNLDLLYDLPIPNKSHWGYKEFIDSVDIIIMDDNDHCELKNMEIKWPYTNKTSYVVSSGMREESSINYIFQNDIINIINKTHKNKKIWIIGDDLKHQCFKDGLIDEMHIVIVPKQVGEDESIHYRLIPPTVWKLMDHQIFDDGVVKLVYHK